MLKNLCHSEQPNVTNPDIASVDQMVAHVKKRTEVINGYMRTWDYVASIKRDAKSEAQVETRLEDAVFYVTASRRHGISDEDILADLTGHFQLSDEEARALLNGEGVSAIFEEKPLPV